MKKISVLGVTGSIGVQTVDVVVNNPDKFQIIGVTAGKNIKKLQEIIELVSPQYVCVQDKDDMVTLIEKYPHIEFCHGNDGLIKIATLDKVSVVLNALVGFVGMLPTIEAIKARKDIAIANKETLVVAGHIIMPLVKEYGVNLLPVDSEHSAIFQALNGEKHDQINKIMITASGGSFRDKKRSELIGVTKEAALKHPNWSMGAKITIDSATMFNKGFEVIEARWLFDVAFDDIIVYIHPESIIHSMVEFNDTGIMAQLGTPDMRLPIQYALTYPDRLPLVDAKRLKLEEIATLHFSLPDLERYKALKLSFDAGRKGGSMPCVLNAANEVAVSMFLNDEIEFLEIEELVEKAINEHQWIDNPTLSQLQEIDKWARSFVYELGGK